MTVTKDYLDSKSKNEVYVELADFAESASAEQRVISPVGLVNDHGKEIRFPSGMEKWARHAEALRHLTGIQMGRLKAPKAGSR